MEKLGEPPLLPLLRVNYIIYTEMYAFKTIDPGAGRGGSSELRSLQQRRIDESSSCVRICGHTDRAILRPDQEKLIVYSHNDRGLIKG